MKKNKAWKEKTAKEILKDLEDFANTVYNTPSYSRPIYVSKELFDILQKLDKGYISDIKEIK